MLRAALLSASRSPGLRAAVERSALAQPVLHRFIAGTELDHVLAIAHRLVAAGRLVSIDHLGENTDSAERAEEETRAYLELLNRLDAEGLTDQVEVSIKLSALGQTLPTGTDSATENAARICARAAEVGTTVTVDMEDHTTTDRTLNTVRVLRRRYPETGAVLQAYLRRTEADCAALAQAGSRVRLCKGAYAEPASVAFTRRAEVTAAYLRCLRLLMAGSGYPMVATHDPVLINEAIRLAARYHRRQRDFEFQLLYGVRPSAQQELIDAGYRVRVYLPYGSAWFPYFMRRIGERPANVVFFLRALAGQLPGRHTELG